MSHAGVTALQKASAGQGATRGPKPSAKASLGSTGCSGTADTKIGFAPSLSLGGHFATKVDKYHFLGADIPTGASIDLGLTLTLTGPASVETAGTVTCGFGVGHLFHTLIVTRNGSIALKVGGSLIVGPGVGTDEADLIAGVSGEFDPLNAQVQAKFPESDPRFNECTEIDASATLTIGVTVKAFLSTDLGRDGDDALTAPAGYPTYDAAAYTVTLKPTGSTLHVKYVFASEEYPEYVGSSYNDVMSVTVGGKNCATVPGTDTPVAVNTINAQANSQHYVDNTSGAAGYSTSMDGLTTPLTCSVPVTPGQPVTVCIAVADTSDHVFDSAVALVDGGIWTD